MNAFIHTQNQRISSLEADNRRLQAQLGDTRARDRHRHTTTQTDISTQADNGECSTVIGVSRKRKSRGELCSMGLKRRREEEETAFKNVAALFGGQAANEIKRVGVTVEYGDGEAREFSAWGERRPTQEETDDIQKAQEEEDDEVAHTLRILKLKNRHSISYSVLQELRMEGFPVPPQTQIIAQSERLGRCVEILQVSTLLPIVLIQHFVQIIISICFIFVCSSVMLIIN